MRVRLDAVIASKNNCSTLYKPRTITWRIGSMNLAQPKPCVI